MRKLFLILLCFFLVNIVSAQSLSNIVEEEILFVPDTIVLNTLSIVPGSLIIYQNGKQLNKSLYTVNYEKSTLLFKHLSSYSQKTLFKLKYRVFPLNFTSEYSHKELHLLGDSINKKQQKRYKPVDDQETFFSTSQLTKSGSISRGITIGNNQDASVNSDFNLQISGKISPDVSISANISDNNIPVQADGTSQHLREFDNMFIELTSKNSKMTVGDFEMNKPKGYFMNYHKKVQGAGFQTKFKTKKDNIVESSLNTAVSKGKFNRQKIIALEGNQGPYKLEGINNELYVIVLSGSEKIYINGELMLRGNENDYIINYNSAELVFTAKKPITKDTRIIAEFEYSEMSYAEFIISSETKITNKNSNFYINIISDHDAKNQSLRQDLSDNQKIMFREIGDNLSDALVNNITEVDTFNSNEVLYRKTDTLINSIIYNNIYVYSTDSLNAKYRLGFSSVGENNGHYIRIQNGANGRVYQWLAPEEGIPQGNYQPVKILISPKKKQMVSIGGDYKLKNISLNFETALTNNDLNTFSSYDDQNNLGYAFKLGIHKNLLNKDTGIVQLSLGTNYYFTHKNFDAFEPYQNQEFDRNWNLSDLRSNTNEHILKFYLEYKKKDFGKLGFYSDILDRQALYSGNRNKIFVDIHKKKISFFADVNRLTATDTSIKSEFIRYDLKIEKKGENLSIGVKNIGEKNIFLFQNNDSLSFASYRFNQPEIYIKSSDKVKRPLSVSYSNREDFMPREGNLKFASNSHDYKFSGTIIKTKKHRFKTSITYRTLHFSDESINDEKSEKTLTGRLEHGLKLFKGAASNSIFLEHVSGNELVREFSYIEVQNSQGLFTWEDFNENNIKELNEFVKANFTDEANYIRVSLPTNEYKRIYNQSFNYVLNLNPRRIWINEKGVKNLLSNFSNKFSFKLNRKISNESVYYKIQTADSSLLSLNRLLNNNLRINIKPSKTTLNFIFTSNKSKLLLLNGIDMRANEFYNISINQRFERFVFTNIFKVGSKIYNSEFFKESSYNINSFQNITSATFKIDKNTDLTTNFSLKNKTNNLGEEQMQSYSVGSEYKVISPNQGTFMLKFDYIAIDFNGLTNTSVSYEILEGLNTGQNYVWSMIWYKKITKHLQLELNYSGRKSEKNKFIHSGGLSVRAIF